MPRKFNPLTFVKIDVCYVARIFDVFWIMYAGNVCILIEVNLCMRECLWIIWNVEIFAIFKYRYTTCWQFILKSTRVLTYEIE